MGSNRLSFEAAQTAETPASQPGAFMAMPAMLVGVMDAASFQRQLYQWAFEQARQTVEAQRPNRMRDLFAIMN
jgi:hypothetical protein